MEETALVKWNSLNKYKQVLGAKLHDCWIRCNEENCFLLQNSWNTDKHVFGSLIS